VNQPEWPRAWTILFTCLAGFGYSAADMIPWSMVGDVADEDEILSGERREGLYVGVFTFLRKLSGAIGVAFALNILGWVGFEPGAHNDEWVLWTLRGMTAGVPVLFVLASAWVALGYPLSRSRHQAILAQLAARSIEPRPS
jgi:Na+/melibiose symporter-like transporter